MLPDRVEDVGAGVVPFGGEVVAGARADLDGIRAYFRRRELRQTCKRGAVEAVAPFGFGQIKPVRRQWLIERTAARLVERFLARLVVIGDLRQALVRGFFRQWLDRDRRRFEIIEQRRQLAVKQRQPMLDSGGAAAFAHRLIEHVIGTGCAKRRDVAGAKQPDRVRSELKLRHRHEVELAQFLGRALRLRIETANRFQRIAKEIEPHGDVHTRREQIDNAAAYRVVAGLAHGGGAGIAVKLEPLGDAGHRQQVARRGCKRLPGQCFARRHALENGVDRGEHDRRPLAAFDAGKTRERHHPLRHHAAMRRHPVVGQAIPGRKFQHLDIRREEAERTRKHRHARTVAADNGEADRRRPCTGGDRTRQIGEHQAFGAVGNAGKKQRPAGSKTLRRRSRRRSHVRCHRSPSAWIWLARM